MEDRLAHLNRTPGINLTGPDEETIVDFVKDQKVCETNEHFKDKARKECSSAFKFQARGASESTGSAMPSPDVQLTWI